MVKNCILNSLLIALLLGLPLLSSCKTVSNSQILSETSNARYAFDHHLFSNRFEGEMDCGVADKILEGKLDDSDKLIVGDGRVCKVSVIFTEKGFYQFSKSGDAKIVEGVATKIDSGFGVDAFLQPNSKEYLMKFALNYEYTEENHPRKARFYLWFYGTWKGRLYAPMKQYEPIHPNLIATLKRDGISLGNTSSSKSLAMDQVLGAMEEIRARSHLFVPKNYVDDKDFVADPKDQIAVHQATYESCLAFNSASTWSDLQLHFYCILPKLARECYSSAITGYSDQSNPLTCRLKPDQAYEYCKSNEAFAWVDKHFAAVFKYIMFQPGDTFEKAEQQQVINAFYRVSDSSNKNECLSKRPRRFVDPFNGTHCTDSKINVVHPNGYMRYLPPPTPQLCSGSDIPL